VRDFVTALRRGWIVPQLSAAPGFTRLEWLCFVLLIAGAFLIRWWGLTRMHFWDECVYLLNAAFMNSVNVGYNEIETRPPLLSLIFAGVFHIWDSDYAAETVTALLNALGPAFLYLAGRKIAGKTAAAIAALLLAFGPFFVGVIPNGFGDFIPNCTGHSLLTDCPAVTLVVVSFWLLLRALERQTSFRFACAGFSLALAVLMRFGSLSSVGILLLLVFAADKRARAAFACAAGFLIAFGPYLCWSRIEFGGFFYNLYEGWLDLNGASEPFYFYLKGLPAMISWLGIAGLAAWVIVRGRDLIRHEKSEGVAKLNGAFAAGQRARSDAFLWLWALGALVFFSSLSHKESRYGLPLAPPLLLLAGIGLSSLLKNRRAAVNTACGIALSCALLLTFWPDRHRFDNGFIDHSESNEMIVAQYLKQNLPSTTVLYTNKNYPDFAYYSGMDVNSISEDGPDLYKSLDSLPEGSILIAYRSGDPGDPQPEPPIDLLDSDRHFSRYQEFPTIELYWCR
jgi:hypothetical protein